MLSWFGIVAPAGTSKDAVNWVSREVVKAMKDPKIAQLVNANGFVVSAVRLKNLLPPCGRKWLPIAR